jgi:hypothetical protein
VYCTPQSGCNRRVLHDRLSFDVFHLWSARPGLWEIGVRNRLARLGYAAPNTYAKQNKELTKFLASSLQVRVGHPSDASGETATLP